jgi:hypothetical protein
MAENKLAKNIAAKKLADPDAATIDPASRQMIQRAHELGIETAFDRAVMMKPCNIGTQGICCKNCGMGPCRLPFRQRAFLCNSAFGNPTTMEDAKFYGNIQCCSVSTTLAAGNDFFNHFVSPGIFYTLLRIQYGASYVSLSAVSILWMPSIIAITSE